MDVASLVHGEPSEPPAPTLKRRASSSSIDREEGCSRKRAREGDRAAEDDAPREQSGVDGAALADELEQELQCGCCAALVYRPVVVSPCQHFFCGR